MVSSQWSSSAEIAEVYDRYLVPLLFEPYALDLTQRLKHRQPQSVLEIAAGTGVVTRALLAGLCPPVDIVATDIDHSMIEFARHKAAEVIWREADVVSLPFAKETFDAVVCQFGVMFFPYKPLAFIEVRRVLRPSGCLLFNVWDKIENNELTETAADALDYLFADERPNFLRGNVHCYNDIDAIRGDLKSAGFDGALVETVRLRSRAVAAREVAFGMCYGSPLRTEIATHGEHALANAVSRLEKAIIDRFGEGPIDAAMQAHVVLASHKA